MLSQNNRTNYSEKQLTQIFAEKALKNLFLAPFA